MTTASSEPVGHMQGSTPVEVFSAASEAQVCRIVLGLKVHGLEGLLQRP